MVPGRDRPSPRSVEARHALAGSGQDHRELAGAEHEQDRRRREVQPATERGAEEARHVAAGQEPADDRQAELQPPTDGSSRRSGAEP